MEDLEKGFGSAREGAGSLTHSWRQVSCQSFPSDPSVT